MLYITASAAPASDTICIYIVSDFFKVSERQTNSFNTESFGSYLKANVTEYVLKSNSFIH